MSDAKKSTGCGCHTEDGFSGPWWRFPPLRNALTSGLLAGIAYLVSYLGWIGNDGEVALYILAMLVGGYYWVREGLEELIRERVIGIDILMLAAAVGSALLGLWDEAAALVILYSAAEGTEEYTYARTRSAIRALLDLAPKEARLIKDGQEVTVPADSLIIGDRFLVRPGEALATDGIIRAGNSSLDESPVTGESVPVDKGPGMTVFAASLNRQGALEVEVTATFANNSLSKIIHLVEQAQDRKGKAQQWIERFGQRYTPAVLGASFLLIAVPWLSGLPMEAWYMRAVLLLVAAAPCALVMSTPVAMAAGIGSAGRRGILIKGGVHLEHLGMIKVVAFDKTGTLTHGKPAVTNVMPLQGGELQLISIAAALEKYSEHPLARAIVADALEKGATPAPVIDFEALAGSGARGKVLGETWHIGSPGLLASLNVDLSQVQESIDDLENQGKTVVLVGKRDGIIGLIALRDQVREGAREAVAGLHAQGIRVVMLSGDNKRAAEVVAKTLGITEVRAGLKPHEKVDAVRELERQYGHVLMVGDGVNDAPALAAATCGVAMGVAGSDAAIEAADVALMAEDLSKVGEALLLGRKARRVSVQNIVFSVVVLGVMIPLALTGILSIAITVLVHEASELLAVANGLRVARRD
ncbi:MAG: heavy metal translocating P-type ATPase [Gallionellales bacterium 35-53-114]|jgi:Cd2+/Zn2+-exporting ATPase|nr:MAG: heavy metal translocating P-type ATPase [Gallionellales bacterium 35-53-114]OYZ64913.1 MAG: heavy metal translocating P-type ATPase [Gallionellales bacterium 24-53-125]OZB07550.1 MAG: heavy metal translocating P-type ATPase [Gallionellales bacterium 39-52-133]HQS58774.1 heavy metal translocating P-type ATPase [Gallionellaceae bacterium]HQS75114.1 heavy metal translocating P-type ATPase [Gallionellaceae bacterium]